MCHTKAQLGKLHFSILTACFPHRPHGQRLDHSLIQVLAKCPVVLRTRGDKQSCEEPSNTFFHLPSCLVKNFYKTVSHPTPWFQPRAGLSTSSLLLPSVQPLSCVQPLATPWTAAGQASLSITNSQILLKLTSVASVMPPNHLILCRPLLPLPSIFPSVRVFSNESALCIRWPKYWSFSFSIKSFQWIFRINFL